MALTVATLAEGQRTSPALRSDKASPAGRLLEKAAESRRLAATTATALAEEEVPRLSRGVARWVQRGLFWGGGGDVARHARDISKTAGICLRRYVARQGSQHVTSYVPPLARRSLGN